MSRFESADETRPSTSALPRRRFLHGALGVAAALPVSAALSAALPGRASADPAPSNNAAAQANWNRHGVVSVQVSPQGLQMWPQRVPAGVVTFETTSTAPSSVAPGLFRLKAGTDIQTWLANYVNTGSKDPATRIAATETMDEQAVFFGGAAVTTVAPLRTTAVLSPGTYYVFNYNSAGSPTMQQNILPLVVEDTQPVAPMPHVDHVVVLDGNGPDTTYQMPDAIRANSTLWLSNMTSQTNEAMFMQITPDATVADVQQYWAQIHSGQTPTKQVVLTNPEGLAPMSSGMSGLVTLAMPKGRYMVTTFVYDRVTDVKGIYEGVFKLLTLY